MATKTTGRIPQKTSDFAIYMQNTDNLQLSAGNPATTKKWQNWGWTAAQSTQWTAFRTQSDLLYPQYADENRNSKGITDQMNVLMKTTKKFDNDALTGFHLLDKVALSGSISDCETFRVKRSTPLANTSHLGSPTTRSIGGIAVGTGASWGKPVLAIKKYDVGEHRLSVTNPDTPTSHALPDGIKFAKVYRYIGTVAPTGINQYMFVGNAKRGSVLSSFADADLSAFPANTSVFAWYIARYESNKGVLGDACGAIHAQILRP
jgi:hypothetical protein